jgi:hypothetical protein
MVQHIQQAETTAGLATILTIPRRSVANGNRRTIHRAGNTTVRMGLPLNRGFIEQSQ